MAGSASPLPAILAKTAQLLCWAKSSKFFHKIQIYLHNYIRNLYFIKILEIQFYLTFISRGKNSEGGIVELWSIFFVFFSNLFCYYF